MNEEMKSHLEWLRQNCVNACDTAMIIKDRIDFLLAGGTPKIETVFNVFSEIQDYSQEMHKDVYHVIVMIGRIRQIVNESERDGSPKLSNELSLKMVELLKDLESRGLIKITNLGAPEKD